MILELQNPCNQRKINVKKHYKCPPADKLGKKVGKMRTLG
jgi:hypothetical protein